MTVHELAGGLIGVAKRPKHIAHSLRRAAALAALPMAFALAGCATMPAAAPAGGAAAMRDGGITLPPRGWLDYCGRNAKDPSCLAVQFDKTRWEQLLHVQASLRAVRRKDESRNPGQADFWQVADSNQGGDCEDIALAARKQLLDAGWPLSALRLATAWTETGEYHVVLTVDMIRDGAKATYILDNRFATVLSYQKLASLGYRFHTRQAARGPNWVVIAS